VVKRRLVKLVAFLLLGAIVNVAVAWGCALSVRLTRTFLRDNRGWDWLSEEGWRPLPDHGWVMHVIEYQLCRGTGVEFQSLLEAEDIKRDAPPMSALLAGTCSAQMVSAGWPLRSMHGRFVDPTVHTRTQIPAGSGIMHRVECDLPILPHAKSASCMHVPYARIGGREFGGRIVPFAPLWSGFAINTVFYAVILWVLFAAPFALRRRRRIRRGLCPACAYPVGASDACTECGAVVRCHQSEVRH
jgi:hypothetical protein